MHSFTCVPFALLILDIELTAPSLIVPAAPVHARALVGLDQHRIPCVAVEEVSGSEGSFFLSITVPPGLPVG